MTLPTSTSKQTRASKSTFYLVLGCAIAAGSSLVVLAQKPLAFGQADAPSNLVVRDRRDQPKPVVPTAAVRQQNIQPAPTAAPTAIQPVEPTATSHSNNPNIILLKDVQGKEVKPSAVLAVDRDLLFLSPNNLWISKDGVANLGVSGDFALTKIDPPKSFGNLKIQEFNNFASFPAHRSVIVLDKSGDLYEYTPSANKWQLFRSNLPFLQGQPDPEF
ncbi:MAG: hypothetical protein HYX67_04590, partial [Candidatus Melainabacteria bacterium]|nr:hypothetical protein [Candidatus Melainabacteria bacterium]